jgi:hypothetical protein
VKVKAVELTLAGAIIFEGTSQALVSSDDDIGPSPLKLKALIANL